MKVANIVFVTTLLAILLMVLAFVLAAQKPSQQTGSYIDPGYKSADTSGGVTLGINPSNGRVGVGIDVGNGLMIDPSTGQVGVSLY